MVKEIGLGTVLGVDATGSTDFTAIAQIRSISGPGSAGTSIDVSTLDDADNFGRYRGGRVDPGEVSLELVYDATTATHRTLNQLLGSRAEANWELIFGTTTNIETFLGFVNGVGREIPLDDAVTTEVTIKVTANPGYST